MAHKPDSWSPDGLQHRAMLELSAELARAYPEMTAYAVSLLSLELWQWAQATAIDPSGDIVRHCESIAQASIARIPDLWAEFRPRLGVYVHWSSGGAYLPTTPLGE